MKKKIVLVAGLIMAFVMLSGCGNNNADLKKEEYIIGEIKDNKYESTWAGVSYSVPEDISVLSREDTYLLMGLTMEEIEGKKEVDSAKLDTVYELYGSSADGSMVIINTFKNIDTTSKIAEMKAEFDGKANDLLKPSYTDETTVTYGGIEFTRLDVTASAPDFVMYQTYLFKNVDEHLFCVSVAAFEENKVEELLEGIAKQ